MAQVIHVLYSVLASPLLLLLPSTPQIAREPRPNENVSKSPMAPCSNNQYPAEYAPQPFSRTERSQAFILRIRSTTTWCFPNHRERTMLICDHFSCNLPDFRFHWLGSGFYASCSFSYRP